MCLVTATFGNSEPFRLEKWAYHSTSEYTTKTTNTSEYTRNKNIKMLKDVGMIVLKSRETSEVYMQQLTD